MGSNPELAWVLRAQKGDQEAFSELVDAYQKPIYNLAYRMLGSAGDAEDAAQETFVRAYTRLNSYDPTRKFSSWILSIASHYCIDRLRRRRGNLVSMDDIRAWRWIPDKGPQPEEQALSREGQQSVRTVLEELAPQYRLAIVLRYWYDLSYEEIAEATDSTESAVKSRLHRARRVMARLLAQAPALHTAKSPAQRRECQNVLSSSF